MKNKILIFVFLAVGAVMLSTTSGFAKPEFCDDPQGRNCAQCHDDESSCITTPPPPPACPDNDGDGYGNPGDSSCTNGSNRDCNDNNASINPGASENCTDGIDNNCNNLVDAQDPNALNCPPACIDADGDGYDENCSPVDCDGSDPDVNPGAYELCDDGTDNNCNGQTDCNDRACSGDPACVAESCSDYGDRGSCKADPRCNWSGKEKSCDEIPTAQLDCQEDGGRWNKKKGTCK